MFMLFLLNYLVIFISSFILKGFLSSLKSLFNAISFKKFSSSLIEKSTKLNYFGQRDLVLEKAIENQRELLRPRPIHSNDYSGKLSFFGFFMGGWIGFLYRPSIEVFGFKAQVPFEKIIEGLTCNDRYVFGCDLERSLAYAAVEYIITGAILGVVIGWVVGKLIKR